MRVSAEERALLQRAADLENRSVTEFVRTSARVASTAAIRRHERMVLSAQDSAAFVEALMNPLAPGERRRAAAKAHRDLTVFSSGEEPLDRYLRQQAGQDMARSLAAGFVLRDGETGRVAGYYTLSAPSVEPTDFPSDVLRKPPGSSIPTALIGRLVVGAKHDWARRFSEHHRFRRFPERDSRLLSTMRTIGRLLGEENDDGA
jgi:uncharacterized protein (DUF1778 family)